jgi:hypothetical protein
VSNEPPVRLHDIGRDITSRSIGPLLDGVLVRDREHPEQWPHKDAREYLAALAKVADDLDTLLGAEVAQQPSWQLFAYMLLAARDYDAHDS